jgi:NAD-dependent oxidoreductase involved in siderophore biosynthesis
LIDPSRDVRLRRGRQQRRPARLLRDPEHVLGGVLVAILEHLGDLLRVADVAVAGRVAELGLELAAALLERVRDVLQEQQSEHQVLVLGRLDRPAQLVRRLE